MRKLFGTDGIRGIAGDVLTGELAFSVAKAAGQVLGERGGRVLIGTDTRGSAQMLETALASGFMTMGMDVTLLGVIPTPGVAYLTRKHQYTCGVVISASHNPYEYNGIKFFSKEGYKLPDEVEEEMEAYILGEKEVDAHSISVRARDGQERKDVKIEDFICELKKEIKEKIY